MKLLVADDSGLYRTMLKGLMEGWGYEVVLAANGYEAQAILDSSDAPSLAIVNCFMPGLGGLELCEVIRARKQGYVYTILLSAADQESDVLKGFELGADDYLCKPFKEPELKARLKVGERIIRNQEALVKENQALSVEASRDSLLRLWNRRAIFALLNTELSRAKRLKTPLSVFFIDLDFFKLINDTYGHLVGDEVLISVTKKVSRAVREYDHVGRVGGEEFLVVLPNCAVEAALEVAGRVRQHVGDEPIVIATTQLRITVSIGLSQWYSGQELPDLLRQADLALYRAKQNGRNRVEVESASETDDTPMGKRQGVGYSLTLPVTDGTSMSKRLDVRHSLALPVRIWGMDATGQMFEEYATTVDVTTTGAHITGIKHLLQRGCVIGVEHRSSRARYRVTWVESADDGKPGKVGVQLIETGKFIWGRVIPRVFVDSEDAT
jgi:two-component system, cell cycle response regulator